MKLKNLFLNIGAMKAGTTWLYANLMHHPDVHFTFEKEIHYFAHIHLRDSILSDSYRFDRFMTAMKRIDAENINKHVLQKKIRWYADYMLAPTRRQWYLRLFDNPQNKKYCADFSNYYALLDKTAWDDIKKTCQNLKVVYILRDPYLRLWSHIKFQALRTGKLDEFSDKSKRDVLSLAKSPHIWAHTEYAKAIRNLQVNLHPDQFRVLFFEDIHANPGKALHDIEEFLEISHIEYPEENLAKKVNATNESLPPTFFYEMLREDFENEIEKIESCGYQVPNQWRILPDVQEESATADIDFTHAPSSVITKIKSAARKALKNK